MIRFQGDRPHLFIKTLLQAWDGQEISTSRLERKVRPSTLVSSPITLNVFLWRPLPADMLEYARMDTHYLLPLYDRMNNDLIDRTNSIPTLGSTISPEGTEQLSQDHPTNFDLLIEVYRESKELCRRLYSKKILSDDFLHDTNFRYFIHSNHSCKKLILL